RWSKASARSARRRRRASARSSRRWSASRAPPDRRSRMTAPHAAPATMPDGWATAAPGEGDLDPGRLGTVVAWLDHLPNANVHSILVARRGALVFEHYRRGADERWRDPLPEATHGPATKHDLRSATKSVTGLLVGLALACKAIPSLDAPVFAY